MGVIWHMYVSIRIKLMRWGVFSRWCTDSTRPRYIVKLHMCSTKTLLYWTSQSPYTVSRKKRVLRSSSICLPAKKFWLGRFWLFLEYSHTTPQRMDLISIPRLVNVLCIPWPGPELRVTHVVFFENFVVVCLLGYRSLELFPRAPKIRL